MNNIGSNAALLALAGILFTALNQTFGIWFKAYLDRRKKRNLIPMDKKLAFNLESDRLCLRLRKLLMADRVFLANFHNGGQFKSGVSIDKFTVVGEDYTDDAGISLKRVYDNTLLSYAPFTFHKLLVEGHHYVEDVHCMHDKAMRKDLMARGVKSLYLFMIKDLTGEPLGFIEIAFNCQHSIDDAQKISIWSYHNEFLNVIKMQKHEKHR